jgi:hypothetical protein
MDDDDDDDDDVTSFCAGVSIDVSCAGPGAYIRYILRV